MAAALALSGCGGEETAGPNPAERPGAAAPAEASGPSAGPARALDAKTVEGPPASAIAGIAGRWAARPMQCSSEAITITQDSIQRPEGDCSIVAASSRQRIVDMAIFLEPNGEEVAIDALCRSGNEDRSERWTVARPADPEAAIEVAVNGGAPVSMVSCPPPG